MLFLPECFAFIGVKGTDALAVMEPLDGPLLGRYRELAADTACGSRSAVSRDGTGTGPRRPQVQRARHR